MEPSYSVLMLTLLVVHTSFTTAFKSVQIILCLSCTILHVFFFFISNKNYVHFQPEISYLSVAKGLSETDQSV